MFWKPYLFVTLAVLCLLFLSSIYIPIATFLLNNTSQFQKRLFNFGSSAVPTNSSPTNKNILIWNSPHRLETAPFGAGHEPFITNHCNISDCTVHLNRTALPLEQFDAILLNIHELFSTLPNGTRPAHQRWVFLDQEPAQFMHENLNSLEGLFNWTMTYRLNSDVRLLYGHVEALPSAPKSLAEFESRKSEARRVPPDLENKTRSVQTKAVVAWFVSNCNTASKREKYVKELRKYIAVDVYGGCGNLTCPRNPTTWLSNIECYEMLEQNYKFYLSFENSFCTDYVTEKFFYVLNRTIVPVVYGGANYSQIAPPHSYINALDFKPKALANYLHFLNENEELYQVFFWWKKHYKVHVGFDVVIPEAFCDLCAKLHSNQSITIHRDLVQNWDPHIQCWQ